MEDPYETGCTCTVPKATRRLVPFPVEAGETRYTVAVFGFVCANCDALLAVDEEKVHIGLVV